MSTSTQPREWGIDRKAEIEEYDYDHAYLRKWGQVIMRQGMGRGQERVESYSLRTQE